MEKTELQERVNIDVAKKLSNLTIDQYTYLLNKYSVKKKRDDDKIKNQFNIMKVAKRIFNFS